MHTSRILEVDGVFVGAAVEQPGGGWRFVASDERIAAISGTVAPAYDELERLVRHNFLAARNRPQAA